MILKSGDPFLPLPYQGTGASAGEDHPQEKEQPEKFAQLGVDNYWKYVTDLIGIRVFFLYREDWRHFHEYITSAFENAPEQYVKDRERDFDNDETHCYIAERPKVYRRNGDSRIYDEM